MKNIIVSIICIFGLLVSSCSGGKSSDGKGGGDTGETKQECSNEDKVNSSLDSEDQIVKTTYSEWMQKNQHKTNLNEIIFAAGRLVESLVFQLNSDLSEEQVNSVLGDLIDVTVDKKNKKLKKLTPSEYTEIKKLLTSNSSGC